MPFSNIIQTHITDAQIVQLDAAIKNIEDVVSQLTLNLSPDERNRFGSINEQNKLLANKIFDYHQTNPDLQSPDVDWNEFESDYRDRQVLETRILRLQSIIKMATDAKTLHDFDNYQNALTDYQYTKYKDETSGGGAYSIKHRELKQFFPNS